MDEGSETKKERSEESRGRIVAVTTVAELLYSKVE